MNTDTITLNTAQYAKDVQGFGGPVPLQIHLNAQGRIDSVTALPNNEDTQFFNKAKTLLNAWDGMTVGEALQKNVDAVSGATYSSRAIINGVQQTLKAYQEEQQPAGGAFPALWFGIGAILIVVAGAWARRRRKQG
ncbi:MAG: FMN-binding protein [Alloprevotella sp.]|nr:FMN-binding protein [Alloprevotella sp.]